MLNLQSHFAFLGIVILACSVFAMMGNSIIISYAQKDNPSNIASLMPSSHSSADFNNNDNNKSQTTSTIRTGLNNDNQQQLQQFNSSPVPLSIKITSLTQNQTVTANKPLKISGISSDNVNSDCLVYADWNDLKPMVKANASGPNGINDFSNWTLTYNSKYHLITEGINELTAKLDCGSSVKYSTVNITGVGEPPPPLVSPINGNSNGNSLPVPISLTREYDKHDNDENDNDNNDEVSSNTNKDSSSDDDRKSDTDSDNQESRNMDNEEQEKDKDKKENKNAPDDESKKDKDPKGNDKKDKKK